jgi:hypothetical protein
MSDDLLVLQIRIGTRRKIAPAVTPTLLRRGDCRNGVWRDDGWGRHTRVRNRIQSHQIYAAIHGAAFGGIVRGGGIVFAVTGTGKAIGSQREFSDEELDDFGGARGG